MAGCTIDELIAGMVNATKANPDFIKMAGPNTPVLDVTDILKQKYSNVKKATLTIYGDPNRARVVYRTSKMLPAQSVDQMISNWMSGIEVERQHCLKDGLYYLVQYPAKLDVQTTESNWKGLGSILLALGIATAFAVAMSKKV